MIFRDTKVRGVHVIEGEPIADERGSFVRTWCRDELERHGLEAQLAQCSVSYNKKRGTLRGMHFQRAPHEEVKIVRCERGRIYDVALDLRTDSPTYLAWFALELSSENGLALYIPRGCAHGMQTLEDDSVVAYQISTPYSREHSSGYRWDERAFGIAWPIAEPILSDADRSRPDFRR